jgi:hypothetical protein
MEHRRAKCVITGADLRVYSLLDPFLNLKYVSDMLHATMVDESML